MAEQIKIKVHYFNDPSRIRYVTREAAGYLKPKWVEDEIQDQPAPQEKKVQAAAPVEDRRAELQAKYKALVGDNVPAEFESWNQARLHIEIVKAETKKKSEAEAKETQAESEVDELNSEVSEVEVTEAVAPSADKPKRKSKKVTA